MNKELPNNTNSGEVVDVGHLFVMIGNAFNRILNLIKSFFKGILDIIIFLIKAFLRNAKYILPALFVFGILGYIAELKAPKVYESTMLIKPYYDSKYQLISNIDYYNALVGDNDFKRLQEIFDIDNDGARQIVGFTIAPGPETENDIILEYETFIKQIDSTRQANITYEFYKENRSLYSGQFYEVVVKAYKNDIFFALESGLNSTFKNKYSLKNQSKKDSLINIDKQRILSSLIQIDSLKRFYIDVVKTESKSNSGPVTVKDGLSLIQERIQTREFELLTKELLLKQELSVLETQQVGNEFFDVISNFQQIGTINKPIWKIYRITFPMLVLLIISLVFFARLLIRYVNNYNVTYKSL